MAGAGPLTAWKQPFWLLPPIACNVGSKGAHASARTTGLSFEITTDLAVQIVDIPRISAMGLRYVLRVKYATNAGRTQILVPENRVSQFLDGVWRGLALSNDMPSMDMARLMSLLTAISEVCSRPVAASSRRPDRSFSFWWDLAGFNVPTLAISPGPCGAKRRARQVSVPSLWAVWIARKDLDLRH